MSNHQHYANSDTKQNPASCDSNYSAISITEFCKRYNISVSTYYRNIDDMPNTVLIGKHPRILLNDEKAWLERLIAQ